MEEGEAQLVWAIARHDHEAVELYCASAPPSAMALGLALASSETADLPGSTMRILLSMLRAGAPVNARCTPQFYPIHVALQQSTLVIERISALLKYGCVLDVCDPAGQTPLHMASAKGDIRTVLLLLDYGAVVNAVDLRGRSSLCLALQRKHDALTVAGLLIDAGADVDRGNCLSSAVRRCGLLSDWSALRALGFLLGHGASPAARNSQGLAVWDSLLDTPLAGPRFSAITQALVDAGMGVHAPPSVMAALQTRMAEDATFGALDPNAQMWLPRTKKVP